LAVSGLAVLDGGFGPKRVKGGTVGHRRYHQPVTQRLRLDVAALERDRVLRAAGLALDEPPVTVTASRSERTAGGEHDYFSEGDYWWPDPAHPDGPHVRRDGLSNPDNFDDHRRAMRRLSVLVPALAAAWRLTGDERFAAAAARHLRAWFLDPATLMNPDLRFAQAIRGITTGRGIGIIDTLHLVEVARAITVLRGSRALSPAEHEGLEGWFTAYLAWLTGSENGREERDAENNHGTCWALQVAEFARLAGDRELTDWCRARYRSVLLPGQMAADGSFPRELARTKPYGYSLFNLDAMATLCQVLSADGDDLFAYELPDGRGLGLAVEFMVPFVRDKGRWPHPPDVAHFDDWPVRQPSLLFAGLALGRPEYLDLWRALDPDPAAEEVVRNHFVRQPALWLGAAAP
jgi:Alginate lyase